mgnify:CR=1 FL=1
MKAKSEEKSDTKQPTIAASKAAVDAENEKDWSKNGNNTASQNKKDTEYVQTDAKVNTEQKSDRKAKQTTNTSAQVAADLEKEKSDELVKPHAKADNDKDGEPTNVQIKSEVKVEEKKWRMK